MENPQDGELEISNYETVDENGRYIETPTSRSTWMLSDPSVFSRTNRRISTGDEVGITLTNTVTPGGSFNTYVSGPQGAKQVTTLVRFSGGGHAHGGATSDTNAAGVIAPSSFTLSGKYPQNIRVVYRAPMTCGYVRCTDTVTAHNGETRVFDTLIQVVTPGLRPIQESTNLRLKPPTADHPSPYWAQPGFIQKLQTLADLYSSGTGKPITITDASLEWGGRFDLDCNWGPPHHEHMNGTEADIRSNDMTEDDKVAFVSAAGAAGLSILEEGNHWHVHG